MIYVVRRWSVSRRLPSQRKCSKFRDFIDVGGKPFSRSGLDPTRSTLPILASEVGVTLRKLLILWRLHEIECHIDTVGTRVLLRLQQKRTVLPEFCEKQRYVGFFESIYQLVRIAWSRFNRSWLVPVVGAHLTFYCD